MNQITHPYIFTLHGQLLNHYGLLTMLHKRLDLIRVNFSSKSDYEKNEIEIIEFETKARIFSLRRVINERVKYYQQWMKSEFLPKIKDLEDNFEKDLASLKTILHKNPEAKRMLDATNWDYMNKEVEGKMELHKRIKGYLK